MREEWRPLEGWERLYEISNRGDVKSVERTVRNGKGYRIVAERILKASKNSGGYLQVHLSKDGKGKFYLVHRLVAEVFLDNPMGYTEVNHLDEDKTNNCADNLEWCSRSYNLSYNDRAKKAGKKAGKKLSKPVIAIDVRTGLIIEFASAQEASRQIGINHGNICACCNGKRNSAGNFYWMYANVTDDADIEQ